MKYLACPPIFVCLLLSACSTPNQGTAASKPITFALIGDAPYTEHAEKVAFPNMIEEINQRT